MLSGAHKGIEIRPYVGGTTIYVTWVDRWYIIHFQFHSNILNRDAGFLKGFTQSYVCKKDRRVRRGVEKPQKCYVIYGLLAMKQSFCSAAGKSQALGPVEWSCFP